MLPKKSINSVQSFTLNAYSGYRARFNYNILESDSANTALAKTNTVHRLITAMLSNCQILQNAPNIAVQCKLQIFSSSEKHMVLIVINLDKWRPGFLPKKIKIPHLL